MNHTEYQFGYVFNMYHGYDYEGRKNILRSIYYVCNLCIASHRAVAFGYLDTIKQRFEAAYGRNIASNVIPFAMNTDFSSVMAAETKRSNGGMASSNDGSASEDKIERMKDAVEEVKQVSLIVNELQGDQAA